MLQLTFNFIANIGWACNVIAFECNELSLELEYQTRPTQGNGRLDYQKRGNMGLIISHANQ